MKLIESKEKLQSWDDYREYMKEQLKLIDGEVPAYVSKDKFDFKINGKPWKGHAFLAGKKAIMSIQKLKKQGVLFREGTCTRQGKELTLSGLKPPKLYKETEKTFLKLRLGYKVAPGPGEQMEEAGPEEEAADSGTDTAELAKQADKINKAVLVWNKTEEAAKKELRKLQKAILDLGDPRGKPVIQGLESILTRLDKVDDEAKEAADAAKRGDAEGFAKARDDFREKMKRILDYVQKDELIKDADSNPGVQIKIRDTITNSINKLMSVV